MELLQYTLGASQLKTKQKKISVGKKLGVRLFMHEHLEVKGIICKKFYVQHLRPVDQAIHYDLRKITQQFKTLRVL